MSTTTPDIGTPVTVHTDHGDHVTTVTGHRLGRIITADWRHWWWDQPGHHDGGSVTGTDRVTVGVPALTLVGVAA